MKKSQNYTLQKIFLIAVALSFLLQLGWIVYMMVSQYSDNHNLSAYASFTSGSILVPLVLLGMALYASRSKTPFLHRLFESTVLAASAVLFMGILQQIYNWVLIVFTFTQNSFWAWYSWELGIEIISIVLFGLLLYWLKKSKRWA